MHFRAIYVYLLGAASLFIIEGCGSGGDADEVPVDAGTTAPGAAGDTSAPTGSPQTAGPAWWPGFATAAGACKEECNARYPDDEPNACACTYGCLRAEGGADAKTCHDTCDNTCDDDGECDCMCGSQGRCLECVPADDECEVPCIFGCDLRADQVAAEAARLRAAAEAARIEEKVVELAGKTCKFQCAVLFSGQAANACACRYGCAAMEGGDDIDMCFNTCDSRCDDEGECDCACGSDICDQCTSDDECEHPCGIGCRLKTDLKPEGAPASSLVKYTVPDPTGHTLQVCEATADTPTYHPGNLQEPDDNCPGTCGLSLSEGLTARILAVTGRKVPLKDGSESAAPFHYAPDGAAVFSAEELGLDDGGWVYVSNSENNKNGGVGSLRFDNQGTVASYEPIATGTSNNCGGGKTPWGTWLTCEEDDGLPGHVWESHPLAAFGHDPDTKPIAYKTKIGAGGKDGVGGGNFESVAYDAREDPTRPYFFLTEDTTGGALRRFRPNAAVADSDSNARKLGDMDGETHWLVVQKDDATDTFTFEFLPDTKENEKKASDSATAYFNKAEGIDFRPVDGNMGMLFATAKRTKTLVTLYIDQSSPDTGEATVSSTVEGAFGNEPDQIATLVGGERSGSAPLLYFCEDGYNPYDAEGETVGVHARNGDGSGKLYTVFDASQRWYSESTGLAFSPDKKRMYVAMQGDKEGSSASHPGIIFEITREDCLPFDGRTLDIKYHADNA